MRASFFDHLRASVAGERRPLERDDFSSNRHPAPSFCLSMISAQTLRVCREGKPVPTFPDHALVQKLAELFNDFSQVHDVFLDDPLSLRFAGLLARAKPAVGWFASVLFRVHHHVSRFSLCRPQCVSLREESNSLT